MKPTVLSITFEEHAQSHKDGQFTIPKDFCRLLGLESDDNIHLRIEDPAGIQLFDGIKQLKSGTEIYGDDVSHIKAGSLLIITASRP